MLTGRKWIHLSEWNGGRYATCANTRPVMDEARLDERRLGSWWKHPCPGPAGGVGQEPDSRPRPRARHHHISHVSAWFTRVLEYGQHLSPGCDALTHLNLGFIHLAVPLM